jgi:hypothetical protein
MNTMLTGEPGDPIIGFRHVKQPGDEVGPWRLLHDQRAGRLTIEHNVYLPELADVVGGQLTAKQAAAAIYDTDDPSRAQKGAAPAQRARAGRVHLR